MKPQEKKQHQQRMGKAEGLAATLKTGEQKGDGINSLKSLHLRNRGEKDRLSITLFPNSSAA